MSTDFTVATKTRVDRFVDNVSIGDVVNYQFDFRPWQDDNATITSATVTSEYGNNGVSSVVNTSGVITFTATYNSAGKSLFSILVNTATVKKKVWLEVLIRDKQNMADDYGI